MMMENGRGPILQKLVIKTVMANSLGGHARMKS